MTTGIALGTLLLTGAILLTPVMNACAARDQSLASCLRETLVSRQLLPPKVPPALEAMEQVVVAAPPSIEVAPEQGDLNVTEPSAMTSAPVSAPLAIAGQLGSTVPNETPLQAATDLEMTASIGSMSVTADPTSQSETAATLQAGGGSLSASPLSGRAETPQAIGLTGAEGNIVAGQTSHSGGPFVTGTLAAPAIPLVANEWGEVAVPPMPAPLTASAAAFATSRATLPVESVNVAELEPLEAPEPPPPPRPRVDPPDEAENEPPIDTTPDTPPVEPPPSPPADDPQFPSVTVLPPPLSGENSSIVTLTLEF